MPVLCCFPTRPSSRSSEIINIFNLAISQYVHFCQPCVVQISPHLPPPRPLRRCYPRWRRADRLVSHLHGPSKRSPTHIKSSLFYLFRSQTRQITPLDGFVLLGLAFQDALSFLFTRTAFILEMPPFRIVPSLGGETFNQAFIGLVEWVLWLKKKVSARERCETLLQT